MYDIIIRNGSIVDGTCRPAYTANICVKDGMIELITTDDVSGAERIIDASGLIVAPGFIDLHTHTERSPFSEYVNESHLAQGVTTVVTGNCGMSYLLTPVRPTPDAEAVPLSVTEYAAKVNEVGANMNYVSLVGHSPLRVAVMGNVNRAPTDTELEQMKALLARELERGAAGMSLGLIYPPSAFSATEELVELAKVVKKYNRILSVHMRNEGPRIFEALDEMIDIAARSGVHIQISHFKLMGKPQWGRSGELIAKLEAARENGLDITCDQYPYLASSTSLTALVPHWAHEGGTSQMLERIKNREGDIPEGIIKEMDNRGGPMAVFVSSAAGHPEYNCKFIGELAKEFGLSAADTVMKILLDCKASVSCFYFSMDKGDMLNIMKLMYVGVGSDGYSIPHDKTVTVNIPHPRNYATFAEFFSTVRENKLMPTEAAVYKMSGLAASIVGLNDRGVLAEGKAADIAIFDEATYGSEATFSESRVWPTGMKYVLVNGKVEIDDGKSTGVKAGIAVLM